MTVRTDIRLANSPMTPVVCRTCGAKVLARKSSWAQTSVQWDARSLAACRERAEMLAHPDASNDFGAGRAGLFLACGRLRDSIEQAAGTGTLSVLDEN